MDGVLGQAHEVRGVQGDQRVPEGSLKDFILCIHVALLCMSVTLLKRLQHI